MGIIEKRIKPSQMVSIKPAEETFEILECAYRELVKSCDYDFIEDDKTKAHIMKVAEWLSDTTPRTSVGLALMGTVGNGKTTLLKSIWEAARNCGSAIGLLNDGEVLEELQQKYVENKRNAELYVKQYDEASVFYGTDYFQELPAETREGFFKYLTCMGIEEDTICGHMCSNKSAYALHTAQGIFKAYTLDKGRIDYILDVPALFIDDLGFEPVVANLFGTSGYPLVEVICYRYDRQLPTFISTNLSKKQVLERYGERFADRFKSMFRVIGFNNESYRHEG